MAEGMQRVRYRNSLSDPEPMRPGEVYEIRFELWPTSIVFNEGHRIRVTVTSSNYPRFDLNPGTGQPWHVAEQPVDQTNRIYCTADRASQITLPVLPDD
jgi:putative CocE/NonD family hydrolase